MPRKTVFIKKQQDIPDAPRKTAKQWVEEGNMHYKEKRYSEALAAYKEAIKRDAKMVSAHIGKGNALFELESYQAALTAYERAIQLKPSSAEAYNGKGKALMMLDYNEEALEACEQRITEFWLFRMSCRPRSG